MPQALIVQTIHASVPGRARFKMHRLRGADTLKRMIEAHLGAHTGIRWVSASTITGSILLSFDADLSHEAVRDLVIQAAERAFSLWPKGAQPRRGDALASPGGYRLKEPWQALDVAKVAETLQADAQNGLSSLTAAQRLAAFGPNLVFKPRLRRPPARIFLDQFNSLPALLLGFEAAVSVVSGGWLGSVLAIGLMAVNALAGFLPEYGAQRALSGIRDDSLPAATVVRDGRVMPVPGEALVPGDVLVLEPGTYVAADCRIIDDFELRIDQSTLTGESQPVRKRAASTIQPKPPLVERHNMAYRGTLVMGGSGRALVVATGNDTVIGRLTRLLERIDPRTPPAVSQLHQVSGRLLRMAVGVCTVGAVAGVLRGTAILPLTRNVLGLAAAAFPTGLLPAATFNLAVGVARMRHGQVTIRKLPSLQTLGAVDVICFDKTGTITRSRLSVLRIFVDNDLIEVKGRRFRSEAGAIDPLGRPSLAQLLRVCVLCNEARIPTGSPRRLNELKGSPTEKALLSMGMLSGLDINALYRDYPLLSVQHRPQGRRYMVTCHAGPGNRRLMALKGSPMAVLSRCRQRLLNGMPVPLDEAAVHRIEQANEALAAQGLRVMGVACRTVEDSAALEEPGDVIWLGLVGMAEPIRKGVRAMIRQLHGAGIETVMITGDQGLTAHTVGQLIDLSGDKPLEMLDASQLDAIDPPLLQALVRKVRVYARLNPAQKRHIVQALQQRGNIVAMTGDGVNDGPALKSADVGIAMGIGGTQIAREASDIVLDRDHLGSLVEAVRIGRTTSANIRKGFMHVMTIGAVDTMLTLSATLLPMAEPLMIFQQPHLSLMADVLPGLALAMEPSEKRLLERPPHVFNQPVLTGTDSRRLLRSAASISAGVMAGYGYALARYGPGPHAAGIAHLSLFYNKLLNAITCRSADRRLPCSRHRPGNPFLNLALGVALALQGVSLLIPGLRRLTGMAGLGFLDMAVAGASALIPFALNEAAKPVDTLSATKEN